MASGPSSEKFAQGCGAVRSRRFLGRVRVGFLTTLGVWVRYFSPTADAQLDHFFTSHS